MTDFMIFRPGGVAFLALVLSPAAALAHAGHLGDLAGHDHVIAGIAIGIAIAVGAAQAIKKGGGKGGGKEAEPDAGDAEGAEA